MLSSGPDILAIEYEAVITPQLQVRTHSLFVKVLYIKYDLVVIIPVFICFSVSVLFLNFTI